MAHYPGQARPLPTLGFLCADPLSSTPPPLSPSVPEAPSLILPSVRFQSNDEAACLRLSGCSRAGSKKPPSLKGHHSPPHAALLQRCGVFVRPDKGCHSSPFPLLCGPGLAAPVEVQMVSSRRGYPRGPWRALSLLQAWLITAPLPLRSPHQLPGPWNHGRHIPTTSTWPSFLLARFDG
ncbi:hypothetical protein NQZ68_000456 [Dissostichus eleginoides]|nr:hypothetical protein NQZ68_000456 [Dissostichus eleginoides]